MAAHLRPLPRCQQCGAPATDTLYNAANAPTGEYCAKHAAPALAKFVKDNPDQSAPWKRQ